MKEGAAGERGPAHSGIKGQREYREGKRTDARSFGEAFYG